MVDLPSSAERHDSGFPPAMGKYVPFARLGSGGMADVFLSVGRGPMGFNKLAVVKRLRSTDDPAHVDMFMDEARLAARLNHPNVVHTYDVGESGGRYFIAMEYLEGQTLQALLSKLAPSGPSETLAAYVVAQGLKGIHYAHELCDFDGTPLGVVHRDVSPHNVYVTYGGEVKILDFGIAKARSNFAHTETGVLKGKVRYMAPEQIGDRGVDRRADVFAFGVLLWEMLAHRPLFSGDAAAVMARIANEDAPSVRSIRPEVSPALDDVTRRALRRERGDRYATADEMRGALEDVLGSEGGGAAERALAGLVSAAFAEKRDQVRGRIKAFLDDLPDAGSREARDTGRASDLPALMDDSHPAPLPAGGDTVAPTVVPRDGPRWRGLLLAVAGSLASVAAAGWVGHHAALASPPASPPLPAVAPAPPKAMIVQAAPGASNDRSILLRREAPAAPPATTTAPSPAPEAAPVLPARRAKQAHATPRATAPKTAPPEPPRVKIRVLDDGDSP